MATGMSSRIAAIQQGAPTGESLVTALRPWRRRITLQQTLRWLRRGSITALLLACLVLLAARLFPWAGALYWALGLGGASLLLGLFAAFWYRPTTSTTAHIVDHTLSLHDRMSTAWEMRERSSALVVLQRQDALKHLRTHTPTTSIPLRPRRATLITLPLIALILVLLLLLPNPMNDYLKQQATLQTQIAKQVAAIEHVRTNTNQSPNIPTAEKQKIDQILRELEAKLQQAQTPTEAQQALSDAQAKLDQLHNPQTANRVQAQAAASNALQKSQNANLQAAGKALANNDSQALQKALQDLAKQAGSMSADERSQAAQDLEKAASQANQDASTSSALHQLAKAISDNNAGEISDAANAVSSAASQTNTAQTQDQAINKASSGVQDAASNLAQATDNSSQQGTQGQQGQQGQGQQGQGQKQQGQGQQGQGQQGQGQGQQGQQGQGQGQQGQGQQGQGQGQQGQGQGGSGGNNGAGKQTGKNEQVYVQGQSGQGSSTQSTDNNNGVVQSGDQVPYSQVIEQYNQMAHDAIDNSNVSPDLKDLVHDYFSTLEGQQ